MDQPPRETAERLRAMGGFDLPTGTDPHSVRRRIEAMEHLLERSFRIPGINYPVGLDSIAGLVPVVGDFVTAAMGAYIVWEARNAAVTKSPTTGTRPAIESSPTG